MRMWRTLAWGLSVLALTAPLALASGCRGGEQDEGFGVRIRDQPKAVGSQGQVPAEKLQWR